MQEKEIRVLTQDGEMRTFIVHPDGAGPYSVAVLYMDGVGYREQVKANARRFAAAGYYVVAPDLYYRMGELVLDLNDESAREKMMQAARSVSPEKAVDDTKAVLRAIGSDPAAARGPKVCVGYCMGARMSLHAASALPDEFVAAAGIHPGALVTDKPDSPHHDLARVRGELYFAFAEIDRTATPETIDRFRQEIEERGIRGEVERLPGVTHGFAMADLQVYDRNAAERHFQKVLELWDRNVKTGAAAS
jgi:carboxymethylenebutenolidase